MAASRNTLKSRHLGPDIRQLALERAEPRQWRGLFLIFRQPQADDIDPAAAEAARHQNDRFEPQRSAFRRRVIEMNVEIIGQRQLRLLLIHGDAVDRGDVAQGDVAWNDEIAEQMRVGCRARRISTKKRSSASAFSGGANR